MPRMTIVAWQHCTSSFAGLEPPLCTNHRPNNIQLNHYYNLLLLFNRHFFRAIKVRERPCIGTAGNWSSRILQTGHWVSFQLPNKQPHSTEAIYDLHGTELFEKKNKVPTHVTIPIMRNYHPKLAIIVVHFWSIYIWARICIKGNAVKLRLHNRTMSLTCPVESNEHYMKQRGLSTFNNKTLISSVNKRE